MRKIIIFIFIALVVLSNLNADYVVKTKIHIVTGGFGDKGNSVKEAISEDWISDNRMVTYKDRKNKVFIVDLAKKEMVLINHKAQKYLKVSLPFQMDNIISKEVTPLINMVKMKLSAVTPVNKTKKIGSWHCSKYDLELKMVAGTIKMTYWVTTDVPFDWKKYAMMYSSVAKMNFIENVEEFQKIKGYPILTEFESNIMGVSMKGTTTVLDISEKVPPTEIHSVPAGYEKLEQFQAVLLKK
jgi:hypothetical protein